MKRDHIIHLILGERARQAALWSEPHHFGKGDCSSPDVEMSTKLIVLGEEVGEVHRAYLEQSTDDLRRELIESAAVCVAILEGIDA